MTVVAAFLCTDGVVIAADSMLTPSLGNVNVGHHKGRKIYRLPGEQLFAFAGDQGQAARFRIMAESNHAIISGTPHPIDYSLFLTQSMIQQFRNTGIDNNIGMNCVLAYAHSGAPRCCVFEGQIQPRLLDEDHYYVALGSGKLSADPFLRFVVDIFCKNGQPTVREAVFLATWTIQHAIDTAPGGIAPPIRVGVIENVGGAWVARELPDQEIEEHRQAVGSAADALIAWRDGLQAGAAQEEAPPLPEIDE